MQPKSAESKTPSNEQKAKFHELAKEGKFDELKEQTKEFDNLSTILAPHGENLLHWAAAKNNVDAIEYLISKKCYVNMVNYYGASPLYYAASKNSKEATLDLI